MNSLKSYYGVSIAFAALACTTPAFAQSESGRVSISVSGGASLPVGGTLHGSATAPVPNLGVLNPALAGVPATLNIESRSQNDVFDTAWTIGGELGYGLSDNGQALISVRYLQAGGNRINVGGAAVGAPVNATLPVFGAFGDYKSLAVELGYRHYFGSDEGLRPFATARAGATRISSIAADFTIPDAPITLTAVPFSKASWAFSGGADFGVSIPLGTGVSIEPEVGIQYTDGAAGDDSGLAGLGLGAINDAGERWDVPMRIRLKVKM
jgi:hypothetical protein